MAPGSGFLLEDLGITPGPDFLDNVRKNVDEGHLEFYNFSLKDILKLRYHKI